MKKHLRGITNSHPAMADADDKGRTISTCGPLKLLAGKCPTQM